MDMVERVAKAIFESDHTDRLKALGDEPWLKWDELADGMRRHFEYAARAAIEAMREPTEEMKIALARCFKDDDTDQYHNAHIAEAGWDAMISAALQQEGKGE